MDNQNVIVITDFLYFKGAGGRIYADRCEIYKDFGLFLYKEGHLICTVKDKIQEVRLVEVTENHAHHYIKSEGWSSYYLVTKRGEVEVDVPLHAQVVLKGDESFSLSMGLAKEPELLERFKEEIERDFYWIVVEKKEDIMLVIQQGDQQKFVSTEDVVTLEQIKENAEFFKERLNHD